MQLLSKSLDQIKGESWFAECGDAFVKHIPLLADIPEDKVSVLVAENCVVNTTTTTTTVLRPFVRDYPGEPVPEETLTHPPS